MSTSTLAMEYLRFSPSVLEWAANRMGMTLSELAITLSRRHPDKIMGGELTQAQVYKIARRARVPLGFLFFDEPPPPPPIPLADLRTTQFATPLGQDFLETYAIVEAKQAWYREYLEGVDAPELAFVGRFRDRRADVIEIAEDIRRTLGLLIPVAAGSVSVEALYSHLVDKVENAGVLVFKNGVVGTNTRRPLSVDEFRGFAIADKIAPAIFINGRDAPAAWSFTLMHELAHIWLGESAISDVAAESTNDTERLCNAVAAEVLVPSAAFREFWPGVSDQGLPAALAAGRRVFRVSELVIARRALEEQYITRNEYRDLYRRARNNSRSDADEGGGDFYATCAVRNSRTFTRRVSAMAMTGEISFREAGRLLQVSPNQISTIYKKNCAIPS